MSITPRGAKRPAREDDDHEAENRRCYPAVLFRKGARGPVRGVRAPNLSDVLFRRSRENPFHHKHVRASSGQVLFRKCGITGQSLRVHITLNGMDATISLADTIELAEVVELYEANAWSSAKKPEQLLSALNNSHALATARANGKLIGIGNAISDGSLVVYFPHLLVHPTFQRQGVGRKLLEALLARYRGFHQLMLTADVEAIEFYRALGFERAGKTEPMWIYSGGDH